MDLPKGPARARGPNRQGMISTWPTLINLGSEIPFAFAIAATVVPNLVAMPLNVSPERTV
jgi:hypothetical protein